MHHKNIAKFVLGISMVASLGLSGTNGHAADMCKRCQANYQVHAS